MRSASNCIIAITLAFPALLAQATPPARPKVVLVELFTSEGCSSCPPADALLRMINGSTTRSGQLIVGISEHVTYWNSLGWADPFSSPTYTNRQNAYSDTFHLDSVYTPQMVINGRHQFVGSDRASLEKALHAEQSQPTPIDLRILSTSTANNRLTVNFSATGDPSLRGSDIIAVLADDADQSTVLRGENSGRTLTHAAVARSLSPVAKLQSTPEQTITLALPASFKSKPGHHLILFAQQAATGHILGADSAPL